MRPPAVDCSNGATGPNGALVTCVTKSCGVLPLTREDRGDVILYHLQREAA